MRAQDFVLGWIVTIALMTSGCDKSTQDSSQATTPSATSDVASTPQHSESERSPTAEQLLGDPTSIAFCYGGYRHFTRDEEPTIDQIKEDLRILSALGVRFLRTYNTQQYSHAANLLKAIDELKQENDTFEMYVMLGAWIECESAWTSEVNHEAENTENNTREIEAAIRLANEYPDIVKIIAVGNEAMVHWASHYFVRPAVILKWVNHLQQLKESEELASEIWITSSDNFAAWGGEGSVYHTEELEALIRAVDYVSVHTYPFHDTYHNPSFWIASEEEEGRPLREQAEFAVDRALEHAISQIESTTEYVHQVDSGKPIHIGETGWATQDISYYGARGSRAAGEFNAARYYHAMRNWSNEHQITCFYFEAFDEQWKDPKNEFGSENHFGMITLWGEVKYALWNEYEAGRLDGLVRDRLPISRTHGGEAALVEQGILAIPSINQLGGLALPNVNERRTIGNPVGGGDYVLIHDSLRPSDTNWATYPSELVKLNVWEGTCEMELDGSVIRVTTGTGAWWGCALEIQGQGKGENLSDFATGTLNLEIRGDTESSFHVGFQSGLFSSGTQVNCHVVIGDNPDYRIGEEWTAVSIPISEVVNFEAANLSDVTGLLYFMSDKASDGKGFEVRNVYWSSDELVDD